MSGLLDSKTRILDTVVTLQGRRQLADGKLKVVYASFTDGATYYAADLTSGSADATVRVYLEQCNLPQDQITFEADDSGQLQPFGNGAGIPTRAGQIIDYSFNALTASVLTGSSQGMMVLSGDEFAAQATTLLASSIDNFTRLRMIGTRDNLFEDDGFALGNKQVEFTIHNKRPIPDATKHAAHINYLESLANDVRLSKLANFKFLPPVNKVDDTSVDTSDHRNTAVHQLGHYKPWGRTHVLGLSHRQLETELAHFEQTGYSRVITFDPTSRDNTLVGQFFELHYNVMRKLDVIDYGQYTWHGNVRHAFFVGKVLTDQNGTHTFVHIFTLVFG